MKKKVIKRKSKKLFELPQSNSSRWAASIGTTPAVIDLQDSPYEVTDDNDTRDESEDDVE